MGFLATIMHVGQMLGPIITGFIVVIFGYAGSFPSLGAILLGFSLLFTVAAKRLGQSNSKRARSY
jgi:hypothetical protein